MSKNKIEWCDATWNPVWGCTHGCRYCYARKVAKRFAGPIAQIQHEAAKVDQEALANFQPTFVTSNFLRKFKLSEKIIFVNSMSDIADWRPEWFQAVFQRCALLNDTTRIFLFLTKRPEALQGLRFPDNCWVGISAESQTLLDKRWGQLLATDCARNNFVSLEPLLGNITHLPERDSLRWVILGGVTGAENKARWMQPQWATQVADMCRRADIPFFFKSWGVTYDKYTPLLRRNMPHEMTF